MRAKPGLLLVKAPLHVSEQTISDFIASKQAWVRKHCAPTPAEARHLVAGVPIDWSQPTFDGAPLPSFATDFERDRHHRGLCHAAAATAYAEAAKRLGLKPPPLKICSMASAWGKCHSSGRVELHWRVGALPPRLADYVVCHEFAHLRHMDHSRAFWAHLDSLHPGARKSDRELNAWRLA